MKLNNLIKFSTLLVFPFWLAACSWGQTNDYHEGDSQPIVSSVKVPEEYNTTEMEQYYPIPSVVTNKNEQRMSNLEPPKNIT